MPSQTVASYADRLQYAVVDQQGKYQTHAFGASAEALDDALATQYESVLAVSHWQTRARGEDNISAGSWIWDPGPTSHDDE